MSKKTIITAASFGLCLMLILVLSSCIDSTAPGPIQALDVKASDGKVLLSWENPSDKDWVGVMVCRKTDMPPKGPLDGLVIASGVVDQVEDLEVENEQTYYYAAWTFDYVGNFSPAVHAKATPRALQMQLTQEGESSVSTSMMGEDLMSARQARLARGGE